MNPAHSHHTEDVILLSAADLAAAAGLHAHELKDYHPEDMGCPGHWRMNKHGVVVYTEAGAERLAAGLAAMQKHKAAEGVLAALHSARVERRQRAETPSRYAWQGRADLA